METLDELRILGQLTSWLTFCISSQAVDLSFVNAMRLVAGRWHIDSDFPKLDLYNFVAATVDKARIEAYTLPIQQNPRPPFEMCAYRARS